MQQGLLEFVEGGELALVEGFEALGFMGNAVNRRQYLLLLIQRWQENREIAEIGIAQIWHHCTARNFFKPSFATFRP